jgi:hypothetical protein
MSALRSRPRCGHPPPRPSLEFERKEAKALLRRLRAGDAEALARALERHPNIDALTPEGIRLADAQLVIAREYGFASWPKLVRYFGDVERQRVGQLTKMSTRTPNPRAVYDANVRSLLAEHRERGAVAARALAAYVPRFYGMRPDDVFARAVGEDDARLAVARGFGFPSWEVLLERGVGDRRRGPRDWEVYPLREAGKAIEAGDLDALRRVVEGAPGAASPDGRGAGHGP